MQFDNFSITFKSILLKMFEILLRAIKSLFFLKNRNRESESASESMESESINSGIDKYRESESVQIFEIYKYRESESIRKFGIVHSLFKNMKIIKNCSSNFSHLIVRVK